MRSRVAAALAATLALILAPSLPALADDPTPATTPDAAQTQTAPAAYPGGLVSIDASTTPFVAVTSDYPVGSTLTYQWLRGDTSLTATTPATGGGANTQNYTPNSADFGKFLRVKVTATVPGYSPSASVWSDAADYSLHVTGPLTVSGSAYVAGQLTGSLPTYDHAGVTTTYQWYRGTTPIPGANGAYYRPVAADLGKKLTLKGVASAPGAVGGTFTWPPTDAVLPGEFTGSQVVNITGPIASVLTASFEQYSVIDPDPSTGDPTVTFQWKRNGASIPGATHATYTLTPADNGTTTGVLVTVKKPGYTTLPFGTTVDVTMHPFSTPVHLEGTQAVGNVIGIVPPGYKIQGTEVFPTFTYRWLRDGVVIAGQTGPQYTPTSAGHVYTGQVIATLPDVPPLTLSASTQKLGTHVFDVHGPLAPTGAGINGKLSVIVPVTPSGAVAYQWYRDGKAISGATKSTYALVPADLGTDTSLRVTVSRSGYTNTVLYSDPYDYSVVADGPAQIIGSDFEVGATVAVGLPNYANALGLAIPVADGCRWYRNGVAISGATSCASYTFAAADVGKRITLKATGSADGFNRVTVTSTATPVIQRGVIAEISGGAVPTVVPGTATAQLKATMASGQILTPGVAYAYQWYRNGAAIKGATKQTFTLASTDGAKQISVRMTVAKAGYTTIARTSVPTRYGLTFAGFGGGCSLAVGGTCTTAVAWMNAATDIVIPAAMKYQWYRKGVAIPGATQPEYTFQTGDYGQAPFQLRVTASGPGIATSSYYGVVVALAPGLGTVSAQGTVGWTMNPATNTLTARIDSGSMQPASPAPVLTYQWYRGATAIPGATKVSYTLNSTLDVGQVITVQIRVNRPNFDTSQVPYTITSPGHDFTPQVASVTPITPDPQAGVVTTAPVQSWSDQDGLPLSPSSITYQWYRAHILDGSDRAPISGATKATYKPVNGDVGYYLFVKYTVKIPGSLPGVVTAGPSHRVLAP